MELFEVGGCVRDELLGVKSKDIDFTVVLSPEEIGTRQPFDVMRAELKRRGFTIFVESGKFFTIRARFPRFDTPGLIGNHNKNLTADFVLARKEGAYTDGRRPDSVEPGTLLDDLARRDFTVNAMAKDVNGNLIDPFGGREDLANGRLRAVGNADDRMREDALRILRAMRFSVTKGFTIDEDLDFAMVDNKELLANVSVERITEELKKMFAFDTFKTLSMLTDPTQYGEIGTLLFRDMGIRLEPTLKGR